MKNLYSIYIGILICCVLILLNFIDIISIINNNEDYIKIYSIGNSDHTQFQSVSTYITWRTIQILILLFPTYMFINKLLSRRVSKQLELTSLILFWGFITWLIYYYWTWSKSGFDHYPGFDPYLF